MKNKKHPMTENERKHLNYAKKQHKKGRDSGTLIPLFLHNQLPKWGEFVFNGVRYTSNNF